MKYLRAAQPSMLKWFDQKGHGKAVPEAFASPECSGAPAYLAMGSREPGEANLEEP